MCIHLANSDFSTFVFCVLGMQRKIRYRNWRAKFTRNTWRGIDDGQKIKMRPQSAQLSGISGPLQRDDELLHGLDKGLRRLQLVYDGLHVALVRDVAVEEGGPLVGRDPQAGLGGDLHDLRVVLATKGVVRAKLFLQLHQGRVAVSLGHLERNFYFNMFWQRAC